MEFYRIAGALILVLSGVAGAYQINRGAAATLAQVESWLALLRYIKVQIDCFSLPIPTILARCDRQLLRGCGYVRADTETPESLEELLASCAIRDRATEGIVRSFAEEFGRGYRDEQLRGCEYSFNLLDARREAILAELPGKKKMTSTLCISGVLALVILLI